MPKLKIALCEDDTLEQKGFLLHLKHLAFDIDCEVFNSGEELLQTFREGMFDLIFLDIYMLTMNGVDTASAIRQLDSNVPLAFITSSKEHALDAYRLHVCRYLEKPILKENLQETIEFALAQKEQNSPSITVKYKGELTSIFLSHILYIEQNGHTLFFHLIGDETIQLTGKLDTLQEELPHSLFYRSHKSYLVNLSHVTGIDKELRIFHMSEGGNVLIRRNSMPDAIKAFNSYYTS